MLTHDVMRLCCARPRRCLDAGQFVKCAHAGHRRLSRLVRATSTARWRSRVHPQRKRTCRLGTLVGAPCEGMEVDLSDLWAPTFYPRSRATCCALPAAAALPHAVESCSAPRWSATSHRIAATSSSAFARMRTRRCPSERAGEQCGAPCDHRRAVARAASDALVARIAAALRLRSRARGGRPAHAGRTRNVARTSPPPPAVDARCECCSGAVSTDNIRYDKFSKEARRMSRPRSARRATAGRGDECTTRP